MQTFLPWTSFRHSARALDRLRLGKQRLEAYQILLALRDAWALDDYREHKDGREPNPKAWAAHPVTVMWAPYTGSLREYMNTMIAEWERRGYKNTMRRAPLARSGADPRYALRPEEWRSPKWLTEEFAAKHRALLISKDPAFYLARFGVPRADSHIPVGAPHA